MTRFVRSQRTASQDRRRDQGRLERESERLRCTAWLLGIARRCVDASLNARPRDRAELEEVAGETSIEEDSLRRLTMVAALRQLSERDQELIALRYGAELTAAQIRDNVYAYPTFSSDIKHMLGHG